ncbi:PDPFL protein, partial [Chloropsis cyanopogon]|nr:PDPFL protein [Chloropsis cyanopogon]
MASVPSAGCLLAKNQYYRSECSAAPGAAWCPQTQPPPFSLLFLSLCLGSASGAGRLSPPSLDRERLPELIDKYWWIKSFFHSEPSPPTVGRKTLSAS